MLKKDLRSLYKKKRDALTAAQKMKWDDLILIQFQTLDIPFVSRVLSFYSVPEKSEVDSFAITDFLHFRNPSLSLAYPRMEVAETTMHAVLAPPDAAFKSNEFGITEPVGNQLVNPNDIDLILVPMLACDDKGHRVGYGKGYYDRYLSECREDCLKIGLSYFEPVPLIDDTADYDIPLNFCITPQQVYVF
ncbi:MAG: 5-formyltetrahydrofolate cyclo-ligase [Chitinophagaceae bacterium]